MPHQRGGRKGRPYLSHSFALLLLEEPNLMQLEDRSKRFALEVLGYQYPDLEYDEHGYDSNWLRVKLVASDMERDTEINDPCLLTWELEALKEFLVATAAGEEAKAPSFIEPTLRVSVGQEGFILNVQLRPSADHSDRHELELQLDEQQLREAVQSIEAALRAFAPR